MSKKVREVALDTLIQIEKNHSYSHLLLNQMIEKSKLSKLDVGLLTEIVYGTIQRQYTLDFYLEPYLHKAKKIEAWVKTLLRLSLYQILYLDRVPDRAVLFEAVEIAKKKGHKGIAGMVNGVLRTIGREGVPSTDRIEDVAKRISVETSHPLWLVEKWMTQYGEKDTRDMCAINLLAPPITARVNSLKTTVPAMLSELEASGIEAQPGDLSADAIKINQGNIAHTEAYQSGLLTIQDESSMLVARALNVTEGLMVLDSCAAPGGKATHIAERMQQTGEVHAIDIHPHKVKLIENQVNRLGLENVTTVVSDSRRLAEQYEPEQFDRILVDAPCTGFGVLRRKPDIKYSKTEADILQLASAQLAILESVAPLLNEGGILVYSTCTINYEENQEVVATFLANHPEFVRDERVGQYLPEKLHPYLEDGQVQILPHYFGTDGFFIATLRKKGLLDATSA